MIIGDIVNVKFSGINCSMSTQDDIIKKNPYLLLLQIKTLIGLVLFRNEVY